MSGVGSSSLPLAGASVAVAADENAYGFFEFREIGVGATAASKADARSAFDSLFKK